MDDARLARIESKLDKLSDAVVSLARMEERMLTLFKRMDKYEATQEDLEDRITEVEKISIGRGAIFRIVDKAAWIVVGVMVALVTEFLSR